MFTQHHGADKLKERTAFPLIRGKPTTSQPPDGREGGNELAPFDSEPWARAQVSISFKTEDLQAISSSLIFSLKNIWRERAHQSRGDQGAISSLPPAMPSRVPPEGKCIGN